MIAHAIQKLYLRYRGYRGVGTECRTSPPPPDIYPPDKSPPDNNNPGQVPLLFRVGQVPPDNSPPANNFCESWNHSFSKLVGHAHPSLYALVSSLHEDESTARITGYVETRVIFITVYVAVTTLGIPASIAVKLIVIPASIAVKHASFSSPDTQQ